MNHTMVYESRRHFTYLQGGRQEFEIGVAYKKLGQKYPNKNIFETWGQKARSWDGQKTG